LVRTRADYVTVAARLAGSTTGRCASPKSAHIPYSTEDPTEVLGGDSHWPWSSEFGTNKTVKARFRPWLPNRISSNFSNCYLFPLRFDAGRTTSPWRLAGSVEGRCAATKSAHTRQSRPDSGLGFQVKVLRERESGRGQVETLCGRKRLGSERIRHK